MNLKRSYLWRPVDIVVILAFLAGGIYLFLKANQSPGQIAKVYVDRALVAKWNLSQVSKEYELQGVHGSVLVKAGDGSIRVKKASCTHKICIKQGAIQYKHQKIVCAPNKLFVTLVGDKEEKQSSSTEKEDEAKRGVDGVTF